MEFLSEVIEIPTKGEDVEVSSFDLRINGKRFDLSTDIRAQISGKVKASGQISYNSTQGLIVVKITEVKFGFLNITSMVFDELKKNESPRLKVREPYIYYQLK
jgi:hypothetical protein